MPIEPAENLFSKYFGKKLSESDKANYIAKEGEVIFNTTLRKCQVFKGGEWVDR